MDIFKVDLKDAISHIYYAFKGLQFIFNEK